MKKVFNKIAKLTLGVTLALGSMQLFPMTAKATDVNVRSGDQMPSTETDGAFWYNGVKAENGSNWTKTRVVKDNTLKARSYFFPTHNLETALSTANSFDFSQSNYYQKLSGTNWQFKLVNKPSEVITNFHEVGFDASGFGEIPVPSSWQFYTDDAPGYSNHYYIWGQHHPSPNGATPNIEAIDYRNIANGTAPTEYNPVGHYIKTFEVKDTLKANDRYILNFQGVESAYYVYLNGKYIGYSEDSFTQHEFDVTDAIQAGENKLAVLVYRFSDGSFLENQDFIRLSGIFRDVILFSKSSHAALDDFTLDTTFNTDYTQANVAIKTVLSGDMADDAQVKAMLYDGDQKVTETMITGNEGVLTVDNPKLWSDEHPNLYTVVFEVSVNGKSEFVAMEYGLREIKKLELANGKHTYGINGKRLMFRGVDRHELSPDEGRAVSKEWMVKDIELMKQYNINAIRTSHYPNSPMLYHLANQYGILILDEANLETHAAGSWIPKDVEEFRYPSLHRMENVFERDKNFSSVVAWSLGNEAEYGTHPAVTNNYYAKLMNSYVKERDSKRPIINERDNREGIVDVRSNMYSSYGNDAAILAGSDPRPYLQIEYAHAMGQSTGYYKKYWDTWRRFENSMGGFIWDWVDQSPLWRIPEVKNTTITRVLPAGELTNINGEIDEATQSLRGNYVYEDGSLADFSGADQVFSLYAEVKPSNALQHNTIMTHGDNQYLMRMNATNQLEFYIRTASNWQGVVTQPVTFESDGFAKIGLTFNKGETNVFVNGTKVATKTLANNINKEANSKLGIGKDYSLGRPFNGLIRKVAVYNSEKDFTTDVTASDSDLVVYQDFSSTNVTTTITKAPSPGYKLKCKDGSLDCYYAYGGDFGLDRYNNDHNFLDNGLVSPDRQPHSGLQQVKYVQQFVQFSNFNVGEKSVMVKNEFNFTNLSDYNIFYYLVKDGVKLDEKKLDLDLAPNQSQKVTFDYGNLEEDKEYYLNVEVRTKQDTKWAQAGYVIAYDQFALSKADTSAIIVTPDTDATLKDITVNESGNTVTLTNDTFTLTIDKEKGKITQYSFGGKDFFNGDAHLNVYRPPVDNDRETGGYFNTTAKFVDAHNGTVNDFSINKENAKRITIQIDSTFKNGVGTAREFLHVYGNGRVIFDQEYNLASNNEIPAVGRMFDLKKEFEKLTYYGRGFEDNYVDRHEGYPMGVYETTPDLSIGGFVRPQDSGNKTGVRWAAIKNDAGQGLLFAARSNDLEVAMNRYDQADIRTSLHPYKLTPTDSTFFRVNLKTAGVGGQDSWGSRPEGYARVTSGVHRYSFEMMPLGETKSNDEYSRMAKEKVLFDALVKRVLIDGKVLDVFNQDSLVYSDLEGTTVNLELFDGIPFKVEKTVNGNQVVIEVKNPQGDVVKRYEFNFKDKAKLDMKEVIESVEAAAQPAQGNEGPADFAFDGDLDTFWHSPWAGNIAFPFDYIINLKDTEDVSGLLYYPRTGGGNNGIITSYDIVSVDEAGTETVVASGDWAGNQSVKEAQFAKQVKAKKIIVRIKSALSNDASKNFASAAEFVLLKDNVLKQPFKVAYENNLDSSTINFSDSGLLDDYSLTVNELATNDYDAIANKLKAQPYSLVDSQIKLALDLKLFKNGELVDFNDPNTNLGTTPIRVSIPLKPEYLPTEAIKIYHGINLEEINYTINNDTIEFNATAFSPYLLTNTKKYQVSFNTDGGNEIDSKYVLPNTMVSLPAAPEKEGFEFLGWTLDGDTFNAETLINKDIELLANWKEKTKPEPEPEEPTPVEPTPAEPTPAEPTPAEPENPEPGTSLEPVDSGSVDMVEDKTNEEVKPEVDKNVNTSDNTSNFALGLFVISAGALLIAYRRKFKKD